jgi:repressor LexA
LKPNKLRPTSKQKALLDFVKSHYDNKGFPPELKTIGKELGISVGAVSGQLKCLAKKDLITWLPGEARSLKVLDSYSKLEG